MTPSKSTILSILVLVSSILSAQLELVPFSSYESSNNKPLARRSTDTIELPFRDNFIDLELKNHWAENRGVFINNHQALNMPNVGFMTFDGRDGTGEAYRFLPTLIEIDGVGDQITSCPINLSDYTMTDGVGMSFSWQLGSPFTEKLKPELDRGDALVLQFKDREGVWRSVWPTTARLNELVAIDNSPDPAFRLPLDTVLMESVIVDERYLHSGFQFRFQYNGILTGMWDLFSVDNIVLDKDLVIYGIDTTFRESNDYAVSKVPSSLLRDYHTIPFSHFINSTAEETIRDSVSGSIYSLDTLFINDKDSSITVSYNNQIIYADVSRSLTGNIANIKRGIPEIIYWELNKTALKMALDEIIFRDSVEIKTTIELITPDTIKSTDSGSSNFGFNNYYARDDGSIESGGSLIGPGEIVMAFDILQDDILSGLQVYFPKIGEDFENTFITFKIYSSLEGIDGANATELLYQQSDVVSYVEDSISLNKFLNIKLFEEKPVSAGRYYIGYESLTRAKIQVGMDLNNYYDNVLFTRLNNDDWQLSEVKGVMAIRPVVSSLQVPISEFTNTNENPLETYPNPVKESLWMNRECESYEVFNIIGERVLAANLKTQSINTENLPAGTYLLKVKTSGTYLTTQFVKN